MFIWSSDQSMLLIIFEGSVIKKSLVNGSSILLWL